MRGHFDPQAAAATCFSIATGLRQFARNWRHHCETLKSCGPLDCRCALLALCGPLHCARAQMRCILRFDQTAKLQNAVGLLLWK